MHSSTYDRKTHYYEQMHSPYLFYSIWPRIHKPPEVTKRTQKSPPKPKIHGYLLRNYSKLLDVTVRETHSQRKNWISKHIKMRKTYMNTLISSIDTGGEGLETDHVSVL